MKHFLSILLLLTVTLIVLACAHIRVITAPTAVPEPPAALQIALPYELFLQVEQSGRLSELEKTLECPIKLISYQSDAESDELFSLCSQPDFKGLVFLENPLSIVPLSQQDLLLDLTVLCKELPIDNLSEQFSARYQGIQYGIVLDAPPENQTSPIIARRTDILSQYPGTAFPRDTESCRALFAQLRTDGFTPFAAYGTPNSVGFSPLLSLFSLSCTGSGEFSWSEGSLAYDKLSDDAAEYLQFTRGLYRSGFIPPDFLTMDVVSGMNLFVSGKTPFLALSSPGDAMQLQALCKQHSVPVDFEWIHSINASPSLPSSIARNVLAISAYADDTEALQAFCTLLAKDDAMRLLFTLQPSFAEKDLMRTLKQPETAPVYDPVARKPVNLRLMKIKDNLERSIIEPYYSKIITGDLSDQSFDAMVHSWEQDGGSNLLEMLTRYCAASAPSQSLE